MGRGLSRGAWGGGLATWSRLARLHRRRRSPPHRAPIRLGGTHRGRHDPHPRGGEGEAVVQSEFDLDAPRATVGQQGEVTGEGGDGREQDDRHADGAGPASPVHPEPERLGVCGRQGVYVVQQPVSRTPGEGCLYGLGSLVCALGPGPDDLWERAGAEERAEGRAERVELAAPELGVDEALCPDRGLPGQKAVTTEEGKHLGDKCLFELHVGGDRRGDDPIGAARLDGEGHGRAVAAVCQRSRHHRGRDGAIGRADKREILPDVAQLRTPRDNVSHQRPARKHLADRVAPMAPELHRAGSAPRGRGGVGGGLTLRGPGRRG